MVTPHWPGCEILGIGLQLAAADEGLPRSVTEGKLPQSGCPGIGVICLISQIGQYEGQSLAVR